MKDKIQMDISHRVNRLGRVFNVEPVYTHDGVWGIILPLLVGSEVDALLGSLLLTVYAHNLKTFTLQEGFCRALVAMVNQSWKKVGIDDRAIYSKELEAGLVKRISEIAAFRCVDQVQKRFYIVDVDLTVEFAMHAFDADNENMGKH